MLTIVEFPAGTTADIHYTLLCHIRLTEDINVDFYLHKRPDICLQGENQLR